MTCPQKGVGGGMCAHTHMSNVDRRAIAVRIGLGRAAPSPVALVVVAELGRRAEVTTGLLPLGGALEDVEEEDRPPSTESSSSKFLSTMTKAEKGTTFDRRAYFPLLKVLRGGAASCSVSKMKRTGILSDPDPSIGHPNLFWQPCMKPPPPETRDAQAARQAAAACDTAFITDTTIGQGHTGDRRRTKETQSSRGSERGQEDIRRQRSHERRFSRISASAACLCCSGGRALLFTRRPST